MKIQHSSIMFIIIFIPIILVTSYFISLQVETIKLESSYDEKLLSATYDAMTAFELNTANEDLSAVSDSLRSIIDASNNIFFNTLCTNLGISNASKSYVQPYIPAMLYTLYDGYYIYSPTNIPEICTDKFGRTIRTSDYGVSYKATIGNIGFYNFNNDDIIYDENTPTEPVDCKNNSVVKYDEVSNKEEYGQILYKNRDGSYSTQLHTYTGGDANKSTYYKKSYVLKSYIPYSARYSKDDNIDVTINYTLDNFMTIEGTINGIYYTKSGYLISKDLVKKITVSDEATMDLENDEEAWKKISDEKLDEYIHKPSQYEVKVELKNNEVISNRDGKVNVQVDATSSETRYWDDAQSAVEYYVDSCIFSNWFYNNLSGIKAKDLKNTQYSVTDIQENAEAKSITVDSAGNDIQTNLYKDMLHNFENDETEPFSSNEGNDPESEDSNFYRHKRNVIKNSITYNLILSMLVYTEESRTVEFNMPVLDEEEWDQILNNVSITAFMEGMKCGLKYYNNYAIVTSTNNEITVTDNEIYYVPRTLQVVNEPDNGVRRLATVVDDEEYETAHRIDCKDLVLGGDDNFQSGSWLGAISFKSKEIKYDKILNSDGKYIYDHKAYTDYNCIVDSNYTVNNVDGVTTEDGNTDVLEYLLENTTNAAPADAELHENLTYKLLAYRIAIAKERNNLYKTTAFPENYGWINIISNSEGTNNTISFGVNVTPKLNEIKKIEVTIEGANNTNGIYTDDIVASYGGSSVYNEKQTISTTSKSRRTLEFKQDFDGTSTVSSVNIKSEHGTKFKVDGVKIYYK